MRSSRQSPCTRGVSGQGSVPARSEHCPGCPIRGETRPEEGMIEVRRVIAFLEEPPSHLEQIRRCPGIAELSKRILLLEDPHGTLGRSKGRRDGTPSEQRSVEPIHEQAGRRVGYAPEGAYNGLGSSQQEPRRQPQVILDLAVGLVP